MNTCAFGTSASMRNVPNSVAVSAGADSGEGGLGSVARLGGRTDGVAGGLVAGVSAAGGRGAGLVTAAVAGSTRGRLELTTTSTPITNAKEKVATARTRRFTRRFYVTHASTRMLVRDP